MFAMIGFFLSIPVVGSFHTDLLDLLSTHHANFFQKWCVRTKEQVDSFVLDSCATTSTSFAVCLFVYLYFSVCEWFIIFFLRPSWLNKAFIAVILLEPLLMSIYFRKINTIGLTPLYYYFY